MISTICLVHQSSLEKSLDIWYESLFLGYVIVLFSPVNVNMSTEMCFRQVAVAGNDLQSISDATGGTAFLSNDAESQLELFEGLLASCITQQTEGIAAQAVSSTYIFCTSHIGRKYSSEFRFNP